MNGALLARVRRDAMKRTVARVYERELRYLWIRKGQVRPCTVIELQRGLGARGRHPLIFLLVRSREDLAPGVHHLVDGAVGKVQDDKGALRIERLTDPEGHQPDPTVGANVT